ncbi:hypothetical protein ADUPG1_008254, partial [Aduncisulcus paluster]
MQSSGSVFGKEPLFSTFKHSNTYSGQSHSSMSSYPKKVSYSHQNADSKYYESNNQMESTFSPVYPFIAALSRVIVGVALPSVLCFCIVHIFIGFINVFIDLIIWIDGPVSSPLDCYILNTNIISSEVSSVSDAVTNGLVSTMSIISMNTSYNVDPKYLPECSFFRSLSYLVHQKNITISFAKKNALSSNTDSEKSSPSTVHSDGLFPIQSGADDKDAVESSVAPSSRSGQKSFLEQLYQYSIQACGPNSTLPSSISQSPQTKPSNAPLYLPTGNPILFQRRHSEGSMTDSSDKSGLSFDQQQQTATTIAAATIVQCVGAAPVTHNASIASLAAATLEKTRKSKKHRHKGHRYEHGTHGSTSRTTRSPSSSSRSQVQKVTQGSGRYSSTSKETLQPSQSSSSIHQRSSSTKSQSGAHRRAFSFNSVPSSKKQLGSFLPSSTKQSHSRHSSS